MVRRAQELPFGGAVDPATLVPLADRFRQAVENAPSCEVTFDLAARELWIDEYHALSAASRGSMARSPRGPKRVQCGLRSFMLFSISSGRSAWRTCRPLWRCGTIARRVLGTSSATPCRRHDPAYSAASTIRRADAQRYFAIFLPSSVVTSLPTASDKFPEGRGPHAKHLQSGDGPYRQRL